MTGMLLLHDALFSKIPVLRLLRLQIYNYTNSVCNF